MNVGHALWKVAPHAVYIAPLLQLEIAVAPENIAPENIWPMPVTLAVFHFEMSSLNAGLFSNEKSLLTSVTALTSQSPIGPYSVVAVAVSVAHARTAVRMLVSVMGVAARAPGVSASRSAVTTAQNLKDEQAVACNHSAQRQAGAPNR